MVPTKVFARNLNYYMSKNGKTQIDLINDLGVNKSTISTWCNGVKMPRMGTIQTLADYFGILKSDLIEDKPAATDDDRLTREEELLLLEYRNSSPERRAALIALLREK